MPSLHRFSSREHPLLGIFYKRLKRHPGGIKT